MTDPELVDPSAAETQISSERQEIAERLQEFADSPILEGVRWQACAEIMGAASSRVYGRGEVLFNAGEPVRCMYAVQEGTVSLRKLASNGREVLIRIVRKGYPLAALAAQPKEPAMHPVSAAAHRPARVLVWYRAQLRELAERYPRFHQNLGQVMALYMQETLERLSDVSTSQLSGRLARILIRFADEASRPQGDGIELLDPLTRQDLADAVGSTIYSVSRVLAEWERQGWVSSRYRRIRIEDMDALHDLAAGDG